MPSDSTKAILFCSLLALQFGLQPLIASRFINRSISKSSIVFGTELEKIFIAIVSISTSPSAVQEKIWKEFTVSSSLFLVALPATLYTIQNVMIQYSYSFIDSMTFNILNQTKTIWAAIWLFAILGQKQSYLQMVALVLLLLSAIILNTNFESISSSTQGENYHLGVLLVLGASAISGLSGTLTQRALKSRQSVFCSAELAVYSLFLLLAADAYNGKGLSVVGMFGGWDWRTLVPVTTNALGGIIIGLVTKYAGGVRKGFALIAGILVTAFAQWAVEGHPLLPKHWMALVLVCISVYLHSKYPPAKEPVTAGSKPQPGKGLKSS